jgi:SAM-dependent methyltransferase
MNYELAYRIGFHPWEDAEDQPSFTDGFSALLDLEESEREPPYGPALDLGCGSGIWGIKLAQRGWEVTGVDIVDKALERARERVQQEGVEVRVVKGDVTDLAATDVGSDFQLVLDTGTFHGLNRHQREAMGREVSAIAADGATLLMIGWAPSAEDRCRGARVAARSRRPSPVGRRPTWGQRVFKHRNRSNC